MRILVVEDETRLANLLRRGLSEEGHAIDLAPSGEEALDWLETAVYDVLVMDIMLPGISGIELCRGLRQKRIATPVLLLTAKDAVADRVAGLDAGADDYLIKPFAFAELSARIRALTRRPAELLSVVLEMGDIRLDPANREVFRGFTPIELGNKELRILYLFLRHTNQVLTR